MQFCSPLAKRDPLTEKRKPDSFNARKIYPVQEFLKQREFCGVPHRRRPVPHLAEPGSAAWSGTIDYLAAVTSEAGLDTTFEVQGNAVAIGPGQADGRSE